MVEPKPKYDASARDERVTIPLDPEQALRELMKVDPDAPEADDAPRERPSKKQQPPA